MTKKPMTKDEVAQQAPLQVEEDGYYHFTAVLAGNLITGEDHGVMLMEGKVPDLDEEQDDQGYSPPLRTLNAPYVCLWMSDYVRDRLAKYHTNPVEMMARAVRIVEEFNDAK